MQNYPGNQEEYEGELTECFCEDFLETILNQNCIKSCKYCGKQVPYCFCEQLCNKVTIDTLSHEYEYLTCNNENCEYLRARCTKCKKLCNIEFLNDNCDLVWCCDNKDCLSLFNKQDLLVSIREHSKNQRNILNINGELFCKHVYYYVDNSTFKKLFQKLISNRMLKQTDINYVKSFLNEKNLILDNSIGNELILPISSSSYYSNENSDQTMNSQQFLSTHTNIYSNSVEDSRKRKTEEINIAIEIENIKVDVKRFKLETDHKSKEFETKIEAELKKVKKEIENNKNEIENNKNEMKATVDRIDTNIVNLCKHLGVKYIDNNDRSDINATSEIMESY